MSDWSSDCALPIFAENGADPAQDRSARPGHPPGDGVGVDHGGIAPGQQARHRRLARADPAGQPHPQRAPYFKPIFTALIIPYVEA